MKAFIFVSIFILLQGCTENKVVMVDEAPLVIQTFSIIKKQKNEVYEFPAVVSAVKNIELKFEIDGRIITTDLVKGKRVKKGQLLAQIDPRPFERKVKDRLVRHNLAAKELKRQQSLFNKGVISQSIVDSADSLFETTLLDLNNAKQDLTYCQVFAPFDAFISNRYIENSSYIKAGDSIATLQDRSTIYFSFDVPERVMTTNTGNNTFQASAKLIGLNETKYAIHYVEHEATPDPITQTYNVTFAINDGQESKLIPGSRAIVTVMNKLNNEQVTIVPMSAIVGDSKAGFNVWLVDENKATVSKKHVNIQGISGKFAIIRDGLLEGDKVVSAGISQMRAGLLVSEYKAEL